MAGEGWYVRFGSEVDEECAFRKQEKEEDKARLDVIARGERFRIYSTGGWNFHR